MPISKGLWGLLTSGSENNRIRRLESKVDLILEQLGVDYEVRSTTALSADVKALADQPRKKFAAVKLHREQTGVGLDEAEAAVAAYIQTRRTPKRKAKK